MNIKENEKINNNLDLARELKKLRNVRMMVISIVADALGITAKSLEERLEELKIRGIIKIHQTTAVLRAARKLRSVLENGGDLQSLRLQ